MGLIFESVKVITHGIEHRLDGKSPYAFVGHDGLGLPMLSRFSIKGAQQHGVTDQGYRLDAREFTLLFQIEASTPAEMWSYRNQLLGWFAPYQNPILDLVLQGGTQRRIAGHAVGDMGMGDQDRRGFYQLLAVRLRAPDPSFYDPDGEVEEFGLGAGGDTFDVPTAVPSGIGASAIDQTKGIDYGGTWQTNPVIRIYGPITNPVITNQTTGEVLDFTGTTIADGDYYEIDTRYGQKSVEEDDGTNRIDKLSDDSDLATFHIEPDSPDAPGGSNSIKVTGSSANANTALRMTFFNRYIGI